jgi:5'-deoxynucleotidase YfbR-like HD superfamily hydrolase
MSQELQELNNFYTLINDLKFTYRFSESPNLGKESTAGHSWRLAMMVMTLTDTLPVKIHKEHALELALIHDLAEVITGDVDYNLVYNQILTTETKQEKEKKAMQQLIKPLPKKMQEKMLALFNEYESQQTPEANYIKALDKLESIAHVFACGMEKLKDPRVLPTYADKAVKKFPALLPLHMLQKKELKKYFEKNDIPWKTEYDYGMNK